MYFYDVFDLFWLFLIFVDFFLCNRLDLFVTFCSFRFVDVLLDFSKFGWMFFFGCVKIFFLDLFERIATFRSSPVRSSPGLLVMKFGVLRFRWICAGWWRPLNGHPDFRDSPYSTLHWDLKMTRLSLFYITKKEFRWSKTDFSYYSRALKLSEIVQGLPDVHVSTAAFN